MEKIKETMFALLRFIFTGKEIEGEKTLDSEEGKMLYALSKKQDLAHIIAVALEKAKFSMPEEIAKAFHKQKITAIYRTGIMEEEFEKLTALFENEQIKYVPLKGAEIRKLYPESWMRTSCDIDILVPEEDVDRAVKAMTEKLSYKSDGKAEYHDVSLFSESGVHVELHFSIKEKIEKIDRLLSEVWSHSKEGEGFKSILEEEYFLFHHIAHMSYHFAGGGCGVRPFIDLYFIMSKMKIDENVLRGYLDTCEIGRFFDMAMHLMKVWMFREEHSMLTSKMEEFILTGGIYGSETLHIAAKQNETGGKKGYVLNRIFMPKDSLSILYPSLNKYPLLYPVFTVARWTKVLRKDVKERIKREVCLNENISEDSKEEVGKLLSELGI